MKKHSLPLQSHKTIRNMVHKLLCTMLLTILLTAGTCSYEADEPDETTTPGGNDKIEHPGTTFRSVLVYMVANNSLGSSKPAGDTEGYDGADIDEMIEAAQKGALGNNRLIIYHHPYRKDPSLVEVKATGLDTLKLYDTHDNSMSSKRMSEVISDFKSEASANKYGLILWSHGSGWEQIGIAEQAKAPSTVSLRAFGQDGSKQMNVTTLANVLANQNFDYVYFDCCHMAGIEVAYELRHVTKCIVGSVAELPAAGMPYTLTLSHLMANEANPAAAAAATFGYYDSQTNYNRTCTMSVIDTSKLDAVAETIRAFYELHPTLPSSYVPQKFLKKDCVFYDLAHYLNALGSNDGEDSRLRQAAIRAIDNAITYRASTPWLWPGLTSLQVEIESHCGFSTFIMQRATDSTRHNYHQLAWYADVASHLFTD